MVFSWASLGDACASSTFSFPSAEPSTSGGPSLPPKLVSLNKVSHRMFAPLQCSSASIRMFVASSCRTAQVRSRLSSTFAPASPEIQVWCRLKEEHYNLGVIFKVDGFSCDHQRSVFRVLSDFRQKGLEEPSVVRITASFNENLNTVG